MGIHEIEVILTEGVVRVDRLFVQFISLHELMPRLRPLPICKMLECLFVNLSELPRKWFRHHFQLRIRFE